MFTKKSGIFQITELALSDQFQKGNMNKCNFRKKSRGPDDFFKDIL